MISGPVLGRLLEVLFGPVVGRFWRYFLGHQNPNFFRLRKSEKIPRSQTYSFGPKFFQIFSVYENLGFFFQALFELLSEVILRSFWRSF